MPFHDSDVLRVGLSLRGPESPLLTALPLAAPHSPMLLSFSRRCSPHSSRKGTKIPAILCYGQERENLIGPAWVMCPSLSQSPRLRSSAIGQVRAHDVFWANKRLSLCTAASSSRCSGGRVCLSVIAHVHCAVRPSAWCGSPARCSVTTTAPSTELIRSRGQCRGLPHSLKSWLPETYPPAPWPHTSFPVPQQVSVLNRPYPGRAWGQQSLLFALNAGMGCWAVGGWLVWARSVWKLQVRGTGRAWALTACQNRSLEHFPRTAQPCRLPALPRNSIRAQAQKSHKTPGIGPKPRVLPEG